jgi:hypothetical protein
MPALKHTHSYVRWKIQVGRKRFDKKIGGEPAYRCNHPECTHFAPRSLVIGKRSVCSRCGSEFILTATDLQKAAPVCPEHSARTEDNRAALLAAKQKPITEMPQETVRATRVRLSARDKAIETLIKQARMTRDAASEVIDKQLAKQGRAATIPLIE